MKKREKLIAFWLVPSNTYKTELAKCINDLAKKVNSINFEPHVTLYAANKKEHTDYYNNILLLASQKFNSVILCLKEIKFSEIFTKSVFFPLDKTDEILRMFSFFQEHCQQIGLDFCPHLSLLYFNLNEKIKQIIINNAYPSKQNILFDRIKLIDIDYPVENNEDIASLQVLGEYKLKSDL